MSVLGALGLTAAIALLASSAIADDDLPIRVMKPRLRTANFGTASSETVSVGYLSNSTDPNRVGVGGVWDFDTDIAGTDSTQWWHFVQPRAFPDNNQFPEPFDRPHMYRNYGNTINLGDHALWKSRAQAGRTFRRHGLVGVWHSDDMVGVSTPISGTRSAWCGLRVTGDPNADLLDEVTGNPFASDDQYNDFRGGSIVRSTFPGFADQWDQILYRDFPYTGNPISVSFRVRAWLDPEIAPDPGSGPATSAWFQPNSLDLANMVANPVDSLMVWVGKPQEVVYDPNRRWLDDVLDFDGANTAQPAKLFSLTSVVPIGHNGTGDSLVTISVPPSRNWGQVVRIAFQVKTNRWRSDLNFSGIFDSKDGAVLIDDVNVGGDVSTFESPSSIRPRVLLAADGTETPIDPNSTWITTGRPLVAYGHIDPVADHPFSPDPIYECAIASNGSVLRIAATSAEVISITSRCVSFARGPRSPVSSRGWPREPCRRRIPTRRATARRRFASSCRARCQ